MATPVQNKIVVNLIDHYDSFTWNVIDWLELAHPQIVVNHVYFDDDKKLIELINQPKPLIISPGPKRPERAISTIEVVQELWGRVPILGICLGHQIICHLRGAKIESLAHPRHGVIRKIHFAPDEPLFKHLPAAVDMAVYNSLIVRGVENHAIAWDEDGEVQATRFDSKRFPVYGLQFHPESFLSPLGFQVAKNWVWQCSKLA